MNPTMSRLTYQPVRGRPGWVRVVVGQDTWTLPAANAARLFDWHALQPKEPTNDR